MIPLARHLTPHLAALLDQFNIDSRPHPGGGALVCDVITLVDPAAAELALREYHLERWRRAPGGAGPPEIRLSDLGELVGALLLIRHGLHDPEAVYPLTFSAPGPSAQPAGIDVLGVTLNSGVGPLAAHEQLTIAEAKSTLDTDAKNAISGIQQDVAKCDAERIADSLFVLKWELERARKPDHLRVHLFVTSHTSIVGSVVCDPLLCDLEKTIASIFNRLEGKATPTGARLDRVLLFALPNAATFIRKTL